MDERYERMRRTRTDESLRVRAREMRAAGSTYDEIVARLGVAKSTVSLWVRDLPRPRTAPDRARRMAEARWAPYREQQAAARAATRETARAEVGALTDRELFLVGVGLYWAEGTKSKSYATRELVAFINSDPGVVSLYLAWLRLLKVERERLRLHVHIHESADVAAAEHYWAELTGVPRDRFNKTSLKRHNPATNRKNRGDAYHGCLVVRVLNSAELYRRIEGWWTGIVCGAGERT